MTLDSKWKRICLATAALVLVRGILVLCVLPPFEGWDEFSHVSYVVYIKEQKQLPILGSSNTPESMAGMLASYPHPWGDWTQTGTNGWGSRTYDSFWHPQAGNPVPRRPVALYEAAQPPLYYLIVVPVWIVCSHWGDLAAIYGLRVVNVLFLALSGFVFLQALGKCIPKLKHRMMIGLLVGSYPIFVITGARVSNDALAIMFTSLAFYSMVSAIAEKGRSYRALLTASVWLALGVLTKVSVLIMAPPLVICIAICWYEERMGILTALKTLAICSAIMAAILAPLYVYSYAMSHEVYQFTKVLSGNMQGRSLLWAWSHFFQIEWSAYIRKWLFTRDLWNSGWSDLRPPGFLGIPYKIFLYCLWLIVLASGLRRGWGRRQSSRPLEYLFGDNAYLVFSVCMVLSMVAAQAYLATMVLANWGEIFVTPSYFMIVLPVWTALVYQAALFVGPRFAHWCASILIGLYVVAELVGTLFVMPRAFTDSSALSLMWTRTVAFHPVFPGPWFILPCLLIISGLLIYLFRMTRRIGKGDVVF
jgi:4-amino-4-deoxy-L-arabinose transferase-like glycosyltransferase